MRIIEISKSRYIQEITYYEENDEQQIEPNTLIYDKSSMNYDKALEKFNLSGSDVNILTNDVNYITPTAVSFDDIVNTSNIYNVYEKKFIQLLILRFL